MQNIRQLLNRDNWLDYLRMAIEGGLTDGAIANDIVAKIDKALRADNNHKTKPKIKSMKNAPKRIFLQLGEDVDTKSTDWSEIHPECVSWCTERINENDLEYVLAFALKENPEHLPEQLTEPNPITPEMLEAYGFEKIKTNPIKVYYLLRLSDERYCDLALIDGDKNGFMEVCLFPYEDFFRVRYEHQMLAMYKGITGRDLVAKNA
jgi:hypothetical protein